MSKLTVWPRQALEDQEYCAETIRLALRIVNDGMCSQPYCGRKAVYGGRCDVHRAATR